MNHESPLSAVYSYVFIENWHSYVIFHAQKLPKVIEEAGIPAEGYAGLRLGAAGVAISITYIKRTDDRIDLDKLGWENFMEGKNFVIDQPVLIILIKTNDLILDVMIELQLI